MHAFATIAIPFAARHATTVESILDRFGNPAAPDIAGRLDRLGAVHFMSCNVVRPDEDKAFIILEFTADGDPGEITRRVGEALDEPLAELFNAAGLDTGRHSIIDILMRHSLDFGVGWFANSGLMFAGTPGMSVDRIKREAALAGHVGDVLRAAGSGGSARQKLEHARRALRDGKRFEWALAAEPAPILEGPQGTIFGAIPALLFGGARYFLWPLLAPGLALFAAEAYLGELSGGVSFVELAIRFLGLTILVAIGAGLLVFLRLRRVESTDQSDHVVPPAPLVESLMRRENHAAQNHLLGVSRLKAGPLRRLTLRFALFVIGSFATRVYRPGRLAEISTIHFARFLVLPGTNLLLFMSNYDGTWESYLEDFINEAHEGLTAVWSNTIGYPRTRNLFQGGATDGDRFKHWARRQQQPTLFWYSAYPELTTRRIAMNAAIRQGLAAIVSDADAESSLSLFGAAPRPPTDVDTTQVQTIVCGGLSGLPHAVCLIGRFGADTQGAKNWLAAILPDIDFGDEKPATSARVVAFSARGLARLGLSAAELATFGVAFQQGMDAPWRARALGDSEDNAPDKWLWGIGDRKADVAILIYASTAQGLADLLAQERQRLAAFGHSDIHLIEAATLPNGKAPSPEPFGFEDGLSQPIIRSVRSARPRDRDHVVEPGEIILGYPDNRGHIPPAATVAAMSDPLNLLPAASPVDAATQIDFARDEPNTARDFGRDGSYLVIRQLEQDVAGFDAALEKAARALTAAGVAPVAPEFLKEWIGAKAVGRWKNGRSLVHYPDGPGAPNPTGEKIDDNDFRFGALDPSGMRCPFGAHIRRANPRDTFGANDDSKLEIVNRHRILRIGRPYVPSRENGRPGLMFMCLNADIERQFEFLQGTWIQNGDFQGLSGERDPLTGSGARCGGFTIPTPAGPLTVGGMQDFVRVLGGGYFFMPGRSALTFLANPLSGGGRDRDPAPSA